MRGRNEGLECGCVSVCVMARGSVFTRCIFVHVDGATVEDKRELSKPEWDGHLRFAGEGCSISGHQLIVENLKKERAQLAPPPPPPENGASSPASREPLGASNTSST